MECPKVGSSETKLFFNTVNSYLTMPVDNWYLTKFGRIANVFSSCGNVKVDSLMEKHNDKILYKKDYYNKERNEDIPYSSIIELDSKGTIAYVSECVFYKKEKFYKGNVSIFYSEETPAFNYLKKYIIKHKVNEEKKGVLNLICKTPTGFSLKEYEIKSEEIDFNSNYNADFKDIDSLILKRLNEENGKGLALLYGKPGSGKTSYIRHLISKLDKRVLYMPPDMASELSNPGLIPFLSDIPNSILIVEDAENVLIKRQGQHNQAISNILNLSDGLLSDCLKIQILATFNTDLSNIDDALLRKGRLIAKYEFGELTQDRVNNLSKKLGIKFSKDSATLAEIYNCTELDFVKESRHKIGFSVPGENEILGKKAVPFKKNNKVVRKGNNLISESEA